MATFSVNQNRQLFVANNLLTTGTPTNVGDIIVKTLNDNSAAYIQHMGYGGLVRSDLISLNDVNPTTAVYTDGEMLDRALKFIKVTLSDDVNNGAPISGQDYILRIFFRQYIGASDMYQETKYGAVHAYSGMTASDFYKTLALSLAVNFSHEATKLLTFSLKKSDNSFIEVTSATAKSSLTDTYTAVYIEEAEQPWRRGLKKSEPVTFDVMPTTVYYNSDEVIWGVAEDVTSSEGGNYANGSYKLADLEYFCMGERGDQYRGMAWPNNIETQYMVNVDKGYNIVDIHFNYTGSGVSAQKSEKDITILFESGIDKNKIKTAFETAGFTWVE